MRWEAAAIGLSGLALTGCGDAAGGSYVATANDDVLVVLEDVVHGDSSAVSTATVHYVLAAPQPLDARDPQGPLVRSMTYQSRFDCTARAWGSLSQTFTFQDGATLDSHEPEPELRTAAPDSVAGQIIATVCDPAKAQAARNHRSLEALEKRYRAAL